LTSPPATIAPPEFAAISRTASAHPALGIGAIETIKAMTWIKARAAAVERKDPEVRHRHLLHGPSREVRSCQRSVADIFRRE